MKGPEQERTKVSRSGYGEELKKKKIQANIED